MSAEADKEAPGISPAPLCIQKTHTNNEMRLLLVFMLGIQEVRCYSAPVQAFKPTGILRSIPDSGGLHQRIHL